MGRAVRSKKEEEEKEIKKSLQKTVKKREEWGHPNMPREGLGLEKH